LLLLALVACQVPEVGDRTSGAATSRGPRIAIEEASVDLHGHVVATFTVSERDLPIGIDEVFALAPRFTLATLKDHPVDGLRAWESQLLTGAQVAARLPPAGPGTPDPEILTSVRQPGYEIPAALVDLGSGRYRYVFAIASSPVDPDETIRVGVWLASAPSPSTDTSSTFDFRPAGGPVGGRELVLDANCSRCHGTLVMHGTRTGVRLCVTCHTWQAADPDTIDPASMSTTAATDPNPLELGRLVHRIHRGKNLPTLYRSSSTAVPAPALAPGSAPSLPFSPENSTTALVGRKYSIVGYRSHEVVYARVLQRTDNAQAPRTIAAGVVFPRDLRDCGVCHEGAPHEQQRADAISRRTCSGCHPDVWYGDATTSITDQAHVAHAGGPQADDSRCMGCHVDPTGFPAARLYAPITGASSAHVVPSRSAHYSRPTVEIVSVSGLTPGGAPAVRFRVKDRTGPLGPELDAPSPEYEPQLLTTASRVPRKLSSFSIKIAGPTWPDYGSGASSWDPISSGATGGNPDPLALTTVSGSAEWAEYVYTFTTRIPAGASGTWAVAIDARRREKRAHHETVDGELRFVWPYTGETVTESPENPIAYVDAATGTWPPEGPAPRRSVVEEERCLRCHGRFELHGGQRHQVAFCLMCHNPQATDWSRRPKSGGVVSLGATSDDVEERSIHFKVMVHRIHTGGREGMASLEGIAPHVIYGYGGTPYFFDEGLFPGDLRDCTLCHVGKTHLAEAVPAGAPATVANESATVRHAASSGAHAAGEPATPPVQAACTGCHATGATFAHVASKTAASVETCAGCHAKGALSVEVAHGLALPAGAGSSFSSIVEAVLVPRCASAACHSGSPPVAFPQLDADAAYGAMVGVPSGQASMAIVDPGAPERSYLLYKLRGDAASAGGSGAAMPTDGLLDADDVAAIEAWIANGAPND
jgi:OmcA/MtrC family decaheme c-type cytochrome